MLRDAIFSGELRPGDPLPEVHLARKLQVSQVTIREALFQLEHAGLAVREPNRRTVVTNLSAEELAERISLRVLLEGLAAANAARRMTHEEFEELDRLAGAISSVVSRNEHFNSATADLEFHRYIWRCSGKKVLCRLLDHLTVPLFAFLCIRRSAQPEGFTGVVRVQGHEPIAEALRSRDEPTIKEVIRLHIESSYKPFLTDTSAQ